MSFGNEGLNASTDEASGSRSLRTVIVCPLASQTLWICNGSCARAGWYASKDEITIAE